MPRKTYPLNALRAFEASARHLGYVKAAEELHVTPAAISHQVKRLEDYLGVQLFRRLPNGLLLTDVAQRLMVDLGEGFERLEAALEKVGHRETRGALTLSVAPMFAVKWLLPRLAAFDALHPEIDVRMSASLDLIDLQREGFDAAVRLGKGRYPKLGSVKLFDESVTPMCSPRLIETESLNEPADLRGFALLHDDSMKFDPAAPTWKTWLTAAGADNVATIRGPRFGQPDHALQAAIDGAGVVLGWKYLAREDLAAGRLVQPFSVELPLGSAFYFVHPKTVSKQKELKNFLDWLLAEIGP